MEHSQGYGSVERHPVQRAHTRDCGSRVCGGNGNVLVSGRAAGLPALLVFLVISSGCRANLTPTQTMKEYERLYKTHDGARVELLTKKYREEQSDPPFDVGFPVKITGATYIDSVFNTQEECAQNGLDFSLSGEKIDGDKAEVTYSLRGGPNLKMTNTIQMLREDHRWKIDGLSAEAQAGGVP